MRMTEQERIDYFSAAALTGMIANGNGDIQYEIIAVNASRMGMQMVRTLNDEWEKHRKIQSEIYTKKKTL